MGLLFRHECDRVSECGLLLQRQGRTRQKRNGTDKEGTWRDLVMLRI